MSVVHSCGFAYLKDVDKRLYPEENVAQKNCRGMELISVTVASLLICIAILIFIKMIKSQSRNVRSVASRIGVSDISHAIDLLFDSPQCATSGIYNNALNRAAVSVSLPNYNLMVDDISFSNGTVVVSKRSNSVLASMIQPQFISEITFIPVGARSNNGTGYTFPFRMDVFFGNSLGIPSTPLNKFVTIYTNAAYQVIGGCYAGSDSGLSITSGTGFSNPNPPGIASSASIIKTITLTKNSLVAVTVTTTARARMNSIQSEFRLRWQEYDSGGVNAIPSTFLTPSMFRLQLTVSYGPAGSGGATKCASDFIYAIANSINPSGSATCIVTLPAGIYDFQSNIQNGVDSNGRQTYFDVEEFALKYHIAN